MTAQEERNFFFKEVDIGTDDCWLMLTGRELSLPMARVKPYPLVLLEQDRPIGKQSGTQLLLCEQRWTLGKLKLLCSVCQVVAFALRAALILNV